MNIKSLGDYFTLSNGVKIPCIGFGTWQTANGEMAVSAVKSALKAGYRHIDTAAVYGNEESVGQAIKESGIPRQELFITTKLSNGDHGYESTKAAFEVSMKKLGLDYLDLYLIHWPNPKKTRDNWQEANAGTWKVFEEWYKVGRIKAIGVSNFYGHHIAELEKTAEVKPMVNQIRIAPGDIKKDVIKAARDRGMLLEAYSPLGGTVGGSGDGNILKTPLLLEMAKKYNKSTAQICVRWCLQQDFLPLPKSTSYEHIASNLQVLDFEIAPADIEALNTMPGYADPFPHPDQTPF
jgi:diketogulonate reductase-like aldo/keto reductase